MFVIEVWINFWCPVAQIESVKEISLAFCRPEPRVPKGPEPHEGKFRYQSRIWLNLIWGDITFRGSTVFEGSMIFFLKYLQI